MSRPIGGVAESQPRVKVKYEIFLTTVFGRMNPTKKSAAKQVVLDVIWCIYVLAHIALDPACSAHSVSTYSTAAQKTTDWCVTFFSK